MPAGDPSDSVRDGVFIALAAVMLAVVHLAMMWTGPGTGLTMLTQRVLLDTDAYMWLNRVEYLFETGKWFDHTYSRINPPEGHEQHWTRPLDGLLLAGGLVLGLLWGFSDGLFYWALILTPLMHLFTLILLVWAVRPLFINGILERRALPLLILVFLAQLPIYQAFLVGRPDHHAPLALLFVWYLGFWLRVVLGDEGRERAAVGLGIVGAGAIWVNVEALLFVALGMVGLGLLWIQGDRGVARPNAVHALALLLGSAVAMAVEWGPLAPGVRATDTLSLAHLGLLTFTAGFWILLWGLTDHGWAAGPGRRIIMASVAASGVLAGLGLAFPEFYGSPFGEVDLLYQETRLSLLDELQPIAALGHGFLDSTGMVLRFAGTGFVALAYLLLLVVRVRDRRERVAWITLAIFTCVFLVLSLIQRRWTDYLALATVIPFTLFAVEILRLLASRLEGRSLRVVRPVVLLVLLLGAVGGGMVLNTVAQIQTRENGSAEIPSSILWPEGSGVAPMAAIEASEPGGICDLVRVSGILMDDSLFAEPQLVMAHTDYGPELLYRTHHSVLSVPNHRPQPGYRLTHRVMSETDPAIASTILQERGVGIVVFCLNDIASGFYWYPGRETTFAHWLAEGGVPEGYLLHDSTQFVRIYRVGGPGSLAPEPRQAR